MKSPMPSPNPKPRLAFYHDGRHPLIYMYETPMSREQYEAAVDELVGTPVDTLMLCLGDGRTVLHESAVGELWGHNVTTWPHLVFRRAHHNARLAIESGNDPLRLIIDRARAKGLAIYPTLLVQQGRGPREQDVRCSEFRFDHPHLEIGAKGNVDPASPAHTCLDFMHDEVRQERSALIDEVIDRYDIDGFELQLNYFCQYFDPTEFEAGRLVMTEWIRQVRTSLTRSGADRHLVVRVPGDLEACHAAGLDVRAWIDESLVDVVVAQTFGGPELIDVNADVSGFVEAASGRDVKVMGCVQSLVDSDRQYQGPIETIRAAACNLWSQGVDGLYLAHWFGNWPYEADFYEKLREIVDPEVMAPKDKQYYVPTTTGRFANPDSDIGKALQLPAELALDEPFEAQWRTSDDLPRWREAGRVHQVLLRFRLESVTEDDIISFALNGRDLATEHVRRIDETYRMRAPRYRVGACYWFIFHLPPKNWPSAGIQRVTITLERRAADVEPAMSVRDIEFEVRYLMGKAHRRDNNDADLGQVNWGNL